MNKKSPAPAIDPVLQTRLVSKFGPKILQEGFTAVPVAVQHYYRLVPGNPIYDKDGRLLQGKTIYDEQTGEAIKDVSYMTPTEFAIMTDIWSWWWSADAKPWPAKSQIAIHLQKSERTIQRYLDRLENKGFMIALYQYNSEGKQISNRYDFTPFLARLLAFLDSMEPPEEPVKKPSRGDKIISVRETELPRLGETELSPKSDEKTPDIREEENSNGVAIMPGGEGDRAPTTIGSPTERIPETKGTKEASTPKHVHQTQQTENRKEEENTPPAELQNGRKLPELPELAERYRKTPHLTIKGFIHQYTPILNDHQAMQDESLMQGNVTRAANLFDTYGVWTQEQIAEVMGKAFNNAYRFPGKITVLNPDGSENRMPFFYGKLKVYIEKYRRGTPSAPKKSTPKVSRNAPETVAPEHSGMSRSQAEILARDIRNDEALTGISPVVVVQQEGSSVATVTFTWNKSPVIIETREKWKLVQPMFARQVALARQREEGESHGSL